MKFKVGQTVGITTLIGEWGHQYAPGDAVEITTAQQMGSQDGYNVFGYSSLLHREINQIVTENDIESVV